MKEFMPPKPLETAVLFLVFNRLDTTKQVLEAIKKAKPPRLYIGSDGARESREGEKEKVEAVRNYILDNIDWECEVKTLFREKNLGCKISVSSAITWFFDNEEQGIILEDDCLPSQSFFWYCEELLNRYKDDMRIWDIGGFRQPYYKNKDKYSYTFSIFSQIWGWATWRSRWKYYDVDIKLFQKNPNILHEYEYFKNKSQNRGRAKTLNMIISGKIDTWDGQWNFTVRSNHGLSIRPSKNLIHNIGFGEDATHTKRINSSISNHKYEELTFPLSHPEFIMIHKEYDNEYSKRNYHDLTIYRKIIYKIKAILLFIKNM